MKNVDISIVTPVFNCVEYIGDAIESVAAQSDGQFEHIVVDGGSTDGTVAVIKQKAEVYPHLRWLSEPDSGQSDAMNKGLALARGSILGFLNADDYYEPEVFGTVRKIFETLPEPSLLVGNCTVWNADGTVNFISHPDRISLKNMLLGMYLEAFPMNSSAYFYHKTLHDRIGPYDIDDHYSMDLKFIYMALMKCHVKYVDINFGNFRYIEGTKTYEDDVSRNNHKRVRSVTANFINKMPIYYQLYINILSLRRRYLGF